MARAVCAAGPWPGTIQLRLATDLPGEAYVSDKGWQRATLRRCPVHPSGGCGFARHGTYSRRVCSTDPSKRAKIARYYCRKGRVTFSLLPDCFAARFPGQLREWEEVVGAAAASNVVQAAALHPAGAEVDLPFRERWVRRRLHATAAVLRSVRGLFPDRFSGCEPTAASLRAALGVPWLLVALRVLCADFLHRIWPPVGFRLPEESDPAAAERLQHLSGIVSGVEGIYGPRARHVGPRGPPEGGDDE